MPKRYTSSELIKMIDDRGGYLPELMEAITIFTIQPGRAL